MSETKKTIVILYAKGFNDTVALDLAGRMRRDHPDCEVIAVDEDRYCNAFSAQFTRRLYIASARVAPWLNRLVTAVRAKLLPKKINKTVEPYKPKAQNPDSAAARMRQRFRKVDNILARFDPDVVLCFTPKAHNKAIEAKQRLGATCGIYAVVTDYALNKAFINYQSAGYFVQNENVRSELLANKVPDAKVRVVGMPFDSARILEYDGDEVAEAMGIDRSVPTVTLDGGRYGVATLKDAFAALADYSDRLNLVVLTGGSDTILRFIRSYVKARGLNKNIYVVENVTDMWKIYDITDVLVTAPTIVTVYEACVKNIPCVLIKPINQSESDNAEYLVSTQMALRGGKDEQLVTSVLSFLNNNMLKQEYLYNQRKFYDKTALPGFCKLIHDDASAMHALKQPERTAIGSFESDDRI